MPERVTVSSRSEKSAEVVVVVDETPLGEKLESEGPNEEECSRT